MSINIDDQSVYDLAENFVSLTTCSGLQISSAVSKLNPELSGKVSSLNFIARLREAEMMRYFKDSENQAISALLVSALWASIDPYVAGSVHGQLMITEIRKAMNILNLSLEEVEYFSFMDISFFVTSLKSALQNNKK